MKHAIKRKQCITEVFLIFFWNRITLYLENSELCKIEDLRTIHKEKTLR